MNKKSKPKLSLDQRVTYQIKVPGAIDSGWFDWEDEIKITVSNDDEGSPLSTLTGNFDQAGLHGFLRRLYAFGLPIILVNYVSHISADHKQQE
jgi:hypothetical protein